MKWTTHNYSMENSSGSSRKQFSLLKGTSHSRLRLLRRRSFYWRERIMNGSVMNYLNHRPEKSKASKDVNYRYRKNLVTGKPQTALGMNFFDNWSETGIKRLIVLVDAYAILIVLLFTSSVNFSQSKYRNRNAVIPVYDSINMYMNNVKVTIDLIDNELNKKSKKQKNEKLEN